MYRRDKNIGDKMKKCFKCSEAKPLSEFYKHPQMADGHVNKCKECNKQDVRENYKVNREHFREYDRRRAGNLKRVLARDEYAKTDASKESIKRSRVKWDTKNTIKRAASYLVNNAIRDGKIEKQYFCSICGIENVRIHGHHDDYARPLKVRWLCPMCHADWHKENGEGANAH